MKYEEAKQPKIAQCKDIESQKMKKCGMLNIKEYAKKVDKRWIASFLIISGLMIAVIVLYF